MVKLSIIIVNWNTAVLLRQCLNSLVSSIKYQVLSIEIIIVDNGSADGSTEMVKVFAKKYSCQFVNGTGKMSKKEKLQVPPIRDNSCNPTIRLIENRTNLGFAKGNNIGIKQANGEYIMLLNSDTVVKEGAIKKLIEFLDDNPKYAIVGPKLINQDGTSQASCGWFPTLKVAFLMLFKEHFGGSKSVRFSPKNSLEIDWLMGAALMARKKVFDDVGGLDEEIFMYMEEVEWFYRARLAGHLSYFCKEAEIIHLGRGSSKSGKKEPIVNIYKGILHFYKKHRSAPEVAVLKLMLKIKALFALLIGYLKKDSYLIETYGQAFKIN